MKQLSIICCVVLCFICSVQAQNVVILGDSNTSIGGDNCDNPRGWTKWFKERLQPTTCISYARSGATWTNTSATIYNIGENIGVLGDNNVVYNQVNRLLDAYSSGMQPQPDVIMIAAGTNDAWFIDRRPQALQKTAAEVFTDTTFAGKKACSLLTVAESVRLVCDMLKTRFPDSRIILLTPLQTTAASVERITLVGNILEDCGSYIGAEVIRQDKICCVKRDTEVKRHIYTVDGTHTNETGARINGYLLAEICLKFKNKNGIL